MHLPEQIILYTGPAEPEPDGHAAGLSLEEIERQAILQSLERNRWKRMLTCRELQISKDTLRRKIEHYGLHDPAEPQEKEE